MILIGRYLSPFVRRVAVALCHFDIPFESKPLSLISEVPEVERHNPLGRVPALTLEDGRTLIDSGAILDYVDSLVEPGRALLPIGRAERQHVLQVVAIATGTLERVMGVVAEYNRPIEKRMEERCERFDRQARVGLSMLETTLDGQNWYSANRLTHADILCTVAATFIRNKRPNLWAASEYAGLAALTERCENLPPFQKVPINND